ncbi:eIF-2-alpha kinase activator GCN1 (GCN1 eIF-2-alpha kinase activator homolog) (GCN1-like protein 1) (General control of amino-acid synthesis 1-like protein 1) (Translational activator GCN1), partial [Durusdinium trenchii]
VKVRQCFLSNLKSGTGLGPSLREAIHTVVSERRAAQLPRLRMAFRFRKGRHMSLSFKESDLDGFITTWQDMAKTYHVRQPRPPRDAHVAARRRTRVSHEERAKRTEAKFQAKLSFLRKAISRTLLHLAKRRKRTCKKWGVEELPDGITVCSFQEPQDSLCAMVRLSDGTQRPGPYRKRLREAERDLTELRRLGRSGDAALLAELFRRDADAMTAFFVQGLGQPKQKRQKKRDFGHYAGNGLMPSGELLGVFHAMFPAGALASLEILSSATPFVLPQLPVLVDLFADSKLGAPAQKAAKAIVSHLQPKGHGIASEVLPTLLAGMQDKRWKVKAACIDVLLPCLHQMFEFTPAQLAESLPQILTRLAEAALEVRAEIRSATNAVLREIGNLVASPEIKKLSQDLVTALAEPTNQKHTQDVLARMGNQTFMSLIDAAPTRELLCSRVSDFMGTPK